MQVANSRIFAAFLRRQIDLRQAVMISRVGDAKGAAMKSANMLKVLGLGRIRPTGRIGGGRGNGRVVMNPEAPAHELRRTADPCDRAHELKDEAGFYVPGDEVPNAQPRQYHASQLTAGGVSWDSVFEATDRRARSLGLKPERATASAAASVAAAAMGSESFRSFTRPSTHTSRR